ncbi:flagellar biosynthesis protein FlhB [Pseudomonas typographi]|uniref:flagellar biosynthesis protein FlhB n=1 Tax=Pseudomonas typographi TaxID=2715964 RepID=UPI0016882DB8|nr:flagellar biosynthesis protein FlhB [Pseudomonas typographi]MBD1553941.1 flagellar biosynthesis protein FlhB [Pseudomonas typographi]
MAESEGGQDKTEAATDKRKRESRAQGEIARSRDLNTFVVMLAGAGALLAFGGGMARTMMQLMRESFTLPREVVADTHQMGIYLLRSAWEAAQATQPVMIMLLLAAIIGPVSLGGWLFAAGSMAPKFSRMNPVSGLKRMFSMHSVTELLKALGKFGITLAVAVFVLLKDRNDLMAIANEPLQQAIAHALQVVGWSSLYMALGLLIIAGVDVPIQLYQSAQKLRMTKQEIRDEYKETEGKPEVKGRIRQMQREISQRRMMANVPKADVVITNPTHYSVALKYDAEQAGAPMLLAKGVDMTALKIREIAAEYHIQIMESPALARSIYYSTEVEQQIPAGLYMAVAQVLAYVYQIRQYRAGRGKRPQAPKDVPIPPDLRRDEDEPNPSA